MGFFRLIRNRLATRVNTGSVGVVDVSVGLGSVRMRQDSLDTGLWIDVRASSICRRGTPWGETEFPRPPIDIGRRLIDDLAG